MTPAGEDGMYQIMANLNEAMAMMKSLCGEGCRFQNVNQMADHLGLSDNEKPGFYKMLSGTTRPRADRLLIWLEKLGFEIVPPWMKQQDTRKELLERAAAAMDAMRELGIGGETRACIHDIILGHKADCRQIQRAVGDR